jgi:hypothetical protein
MLPQGTKLRLAMALVICLFLGVGKDQDDMIGV